MVHSRGWGWFDCWPKRAGRHDGIRTPVLLSIYTAICTTWDLGEVKLPRPRHSLSTRTGVISRGGITYDAVCSRHPRPLTCLSILTGQRASSGTAYLQRVGTSRCPQSRHTQSRPGGLSKLGWVDTIVSVPGWMPAPGTDRRWLI